MALEPCANDSNFKDQMAHKKQYPESWGAADWQSIAPAVYRVARRLAAHYGLSNFEMSRIGEVAKDCLKSAGNDPEKVDLDAARPALAALLGKL